MSEDQNSGVLEPPRALFSSQPLQWLRFFGPGAVIASITIGSGELLFPSRGGALFGYRCLWIFVLFAFMKWLITYFSLRHIILTGAHPFQRWSHIPGPSGWMSVFLVLILVVCQPLWFSFLSGALGTHSVWFFGNGDLYIWATVWCLGAYILLWVGGYDFLEKVQIVFLGLMLIGVFAAVFAVKPDWFEVLYGMFVPQKLAYPDWAMEKVPSLRERSIWGEVMVYAAAIGGQGSDYLGYASFIREKKWGRSHLPVATPQEIEVVGTEPRHPARLWLRAALIDSTISFAMVVIIAVAFAILGAMILQANHQIPADEELLSYQASFLTDLAPWLRSLYGIAVILSFFGILYASPVSAYHVVKEYVNTLPGVRDRLGPKMIRFVMITWSLAGGVVLLWITKAYPEIELIDIVTPAGIFTGVLACGFYALANPWVDRRFLPASLRLPKILVATSIVSGIGFLVCAAKALWDYDPKSGLGYVSLGIGLAVSMLVAWGLSRGRQS